MAKPSQAEIEQMIQYVRPGTRDLARRDINQALNSPVSNLLLKVAPYYYNNGTSKELLRLNGTVACQYKGNRYNIPIEIWLQQDHPNIPPLAYVKPTPDMYISPTNQNVQPDGTIIIPYLEDWRQSNSNLAGLLEAMVEEFSQSPPLYTKAGVTKHLTPHTTTMSSANSNASPSLNIVQLVKSVRSTNHDLVCRDINQALDSSVSNLLLKVVPYYYNNGTSKDLLCLIGTVACQYKGNRYNIPIEIWLQHDHPNIPPLAYVKPTPDMYISPTNQNVQPDGTIIIPYLKNWRQSNSNLAGLLKAMVEEFSQSPPLYTKAGVTKHLTPHTTTMLSANSNASPSLYNVVVPTSSASLPLLNTSTSTSNTTLSTTHNPTSSMASNNIDEQNHTHRFSDIVAEPRQMLLPIQGFEQMPIVSLEEAIKPLISLVPDIEQMVWIAKQNCSHPKDGLTSDESASIMLYTMEWIPYENSFYVTLNTALRAANRQDLKSWFLYLQLIINALHKLPSTHRVVYRGVKMDLTAQYSRGNIIVWWGFSSCTLSIETLENERFLGKSGNRTLFSIECDSGKNIRSHSFYPSEDEVLLFPARQFEVIGCLNQGNGLQIVQLRETKPDFPFIKLPSL